MNPAASTMKGDAPSLRHSALSAAVAAAVSRQAAAAPA